MAMVSSSLSSTGGGRSSSRLNPDAPLFIPAAVRSVEDFSPEWWGLITTSTWFRDYWLSQRQEDGFDGDDVVDLLPDTIDDELFDMDEAQFEEFLHYSETTTHANKSRDDAKGIFQNGFAKDAEAVIKNLNLSMERGPKSNMESPKYWEKPAKYISPKCSPRGRIQQPR